MPAEHSYPKPHVTSPFVASSVRIALIQGVFQTRLLGALHKLWHA